MRQAMGCIHYAASRHRPRIAGPDHKITGALTPLHIRDEIHIRAFVAGVDNSAPNISFMEEYPLRVVWRLRGSTGFVIPAQAGIQSKLLMQVAFMGGGMVVCDQQKTVDPIIPAKAGIQFIRNVARRASVYVCWIPDQVRDDMGSWLV